MSDAFADVAKMKNIKEAIKSHEGQLVELTLENGRKREKNKIGRLTEVYPSLFIVEYQDFLLTSFILSCYYFTYFDILPRKKAQVKAFSYLFSISACSSGLK